MSSLPISGKFVDESITIHCIFILSGKKILCRPKISDMSTRESTWYINSLLLLLLHLHIICYINSLLLLLLHLHIICYINSLLLLLLLLHLHIICYINSLLLLLLLHLHIICYINSLLLLLLHLHIICYINSLLLLLLHLRIICYINSLLLLLLHLHIISTGISARTTPTLPPNPPGDFGGIYPPLGITNPPLGTTPGLTASGTSPGLSETAGTSAQTVTPVASLGRISLLSRITQWLIIIFWDYSSGESMFVVYFWGVVVSYCKPFTAVQWWNSDI